MVSGWTMRLRMIVRITLAVESEPAMMFEKVQARGALTMSKSAEG